MATDRAGPAGIDSVVLARAMARSGRNRIRPGPFDDFAAQVRAMLATDVAARLGNDEASIHSLGRRILLVYTWDDHYFTATPTSDFARRVGADTLVIPSRCGHDIESCELANFAPAVQRFLKSKP